LPAGIPVHVGGADTQCALLGAGAAEAGQAAVTLGTTSPVQVVVANPVLDPGENLWAGCHVVPDRWVLESNCGSSGDAFEWLLDLLLPGAQDRYLEAEALAGAAGPSSVFAFVGPRVFDLTKIRPDLPGALLFPFPSLQLRPDRGQLIRAMMESIAFAVRANLEQIETVSPGSVASLRAGGGMSRSSLLIQLIADATGLPVERAQVAETTAMGCTALVCGAAGVYGDASEAARAMCATTTTAPEGGAHSRDDARFAKWRALYDAVETLSI
jgi:autoinducer 2 (AI-2) kinase